MQKMFSAPAKIILFGEHAVVYGKPAIAIPISNLRATAEIVPNSGSGLYIHAADLDALLPVEIDSDLMDSALTVTARLVLQHLGLSAPDATIRLKSSIPMASGLGSGAAVSAALVRAVAATCGVEASNEQVNDIVFEVEKIYHGTPSGIDNTVIVYERPVFFVKGQPIETLKIGAPFQVVIADTGQAALTKETVGDVRKLHDADPDHIDPILQKIGEIAHAARELIEDGQPQRLGSLMNQNHTLLSELTVSSPQLDQLVDAAMNNGALGAKLSGGGRGGNMLALVTDKTCEDVRQALLDAGAKTAFIATIG